MIIAGKLRATKSALAMDFEQMVGVVMALTMTDFYNSMTTYADNRVWQDVYRPMTIAGEVYLKLTVIDDVLIVCIKKFRFCNEFSNTTDHFLLLLVPYFQ